MNIPLLPHVSKLRLARFGKLQRACKLSEAEIKLSLVFIRRLVT